LSNQVHCGIPDPLLFLNETFKQAKLDAMTYVSRVAHLHARASRVYALSAHAYAAVSYAATHPILREALAKLEGQAGSVPLSLIDVPTPGSLMSKYFFSDNPFVGVSSSSPSGTEALSRRKQIRKPRTVVDVIYSPSLSPPVSTCKDSLSSSDKGDGWSFMDLAEDDTASDTSLAMEREPSIRFGRRATNSIHNIPPDQLGYANIEFEDGTIDAVDVTRRHPHIIYAASQPGERTWLFHQKRTLLGAPRWAFDPVANPSWPRLPAVPPSCFRLMDLPGTRDELWKQVRVSTGSITSSPIITTDAVTRQIAELSLRETFDADEAERALWRAERIRRPIFVSQEGRYVFAEDGWPILIPASLMEIELSPTYPFLPYQPPDNYRPQMEKNARLAAWARLITRVGSIHNSEELEIMDGRAAARVNREYSLRQKGYPFKDGKVKPPTKANHFFMPVSTDWFFNAEGFPSTVPFPYAANTNRSNPAPRPIPRNPPKNFFARHSRHS